MKNIPHLILASLLLVSFSTCKRNLYTPQDQSERYIRFGNGGGFTGAVTSYSLMENGQLFRHESLTDTLYTLPRLRKKEYKPLFEAMGSLDTSLFGIDQPGNRYYFLEWNTPDGQRRSTWGASDYEVPPALKKVYQDLLESVRIKE